MALGRCAGDGLLPPTVLTTLCPCLTEVAKGAITKVNNTETRAELARALYNLSLFGGWDGDGAALMCLQRTLRFNADSSGIIIWDISFGNFMGMSYLRHAWFFCSAS